MLFDKLLFLFYPVNSLFNPFGYFRPALIVRYIIHPFVSGQPLNFGNFHIVPVDLFDPYGDHFLVMVFINLNQKLTANS